MRTSSIILIETLEMSFVGNSFLRKFRSIFFNLFKHKYFIFYKIGIDEVIAQENSSNIWLIVSKLNSVLIQMFPVLIKRKLEQFN